MQELERHKLGFWGLIMFLFLNLCIGCMAVFGLEELSKLYIFKE